MQFRSSPYGSITPVVKNLLIINALFFGATYMMQQTIELNLLEYLAIYYPGSPFFHFYQIATHMFMHDGFLHIALNMFGLWMFGTMLERIWGPKRFLLYYFICGLGAVFLHMGIGGIKMLYYVGELAPEIVDYHWVRDFSITTQNHIKEVYAPMVGASGAVMGLVLAFCLLFPNQELMFLFFPVPVKAKYFLLIIVAFELINGFIGWSNIAHFAHLGGMLAGFITIKIWSGNRTHFY